MGQAHVVPQTHFQIRGKSIQILPRPYPDSWVYYYIQKHECTFLYFYIFPHSISYLDFQDNTISNSPSLLVEQQLLNNGLITHYLRPRTSINPPEYPTLNPLSILYSLGPGYKKLSEILKLVMNTKLSLKFLTHRCCTR